VPEAVAQGIVHLEDDRRYAVPVVMVCPEFSPEQAREWVEAGEIPELAKAEKVEYVDIDSGHWPMFTRPAELAEVLAGLAG
jgi:pimeloyl-ACP methyl ester carboxylesterase